MKKRLVLAFIGSGLLLAGAFGGYRWLTEWRWQETTDDAYLQADIIPISAKVAGHIASLEVGDNQMVHKGEVLLRIDNRDYQAKVDEARALVAARQATLANLEARLSLQETQIGAADAQVSSAAAELTRSKADLQRSQTLAREEFATRQQLDSNQADALKAGAGVRGAQANLDASRRQLAVLRSERAMDQAQLEQANAALAAAELDLSQTVVTAPGDGRVGNRGAQVGLYARTGTPLLSLVPVDKVWVDANYKETQIGRIHPGQPVRVQVDAFPGRGINGRVDSFAPASGAKFTLLPPDNATGNFTKVVQRIPTKILLDPANPLAGALRPGMSVVVTVETKDDGTASGAPPAGNVVAAAP